jgi:predicted dehydrogenase
MERKDSITRRDFLKKTTLFAVGAPYVISKSVGSATGETAASDKIVMGIIGPGMQGKGLLNQFMRYPDTQFVAVCDVSTIRRNSAGDMVERHYARDKKSGNYKGCGLYNDFRKLVARDDIEAVIIAVPDHWHAIPVIEAAKAGMDIYCEKPLSLTINEARQMVNAVRKYNRVFQTGSMQRSDDKFRLACELVRSGRIGKVQTVHVGVGGPSRDCDLPSQPIPEGLDWNLWLGPAPYRGYHERICPKGLYNFFPNWRDYKDYSGGGMTDWGAHHFDIAQWGLGMDDTGPVEIIPPDGKEYKTLTYKYANGVVMYHGGANGVKFTGPKGMIEVNRGYFKSDPESIGKEPLGPNDVHLYKSGDHYRDFLDCVRSRKKPICDVEIGCRSVTVCHLGNLAYWNKRPLKWDPKTERFIGDDEANTWLDRPKRAPWSLPKV